MKKYSSYKKVHLDDSINNISTYVATILIFVKYAFRGCDEGIHRTETKY